VYCVCGGSEGEEPGLSGDEHPHGDVRTGQAFMADVVHAFMESPQFERGALFIVYDEWGGFFDHVQPPRVPDDRNDTDIDKDFGLMGFRIPAIAVSPWVRRGYVAHSVYGFESILRLIEYRFGLQPLTGRDAHAGNIGRSFDWASKPRLDLPDLPRPEHVVSMACPGTAPGGVRAKDHDALDLVSSGYLERMGFSYSAATPVSTFREPSKVLQAYAG
jgi:phospholipase C